MKGSEIKANIMVEKYFVIWPENGDQFSDEGLESYEEAKAAAEAYLTENKEGEGLYYIAKVIEKLYYKKEVK